MAKELTRRDFLKLAAAGAGAIALGGLVSCSNNKDNPKCDSEHIVRLNDGDYVMVGDFKVEVHFQTHGSIPLEEYLKNFSGDELPAEEYLKYYAAIDVSRNGNKNPDGNDWSDNRILVGHTFRFDFDQTKQEFKRVIYRCSLDAFAFWDMNEFPVNTPVPSVTPLSQPTPAKTRTPAAVFP